MIGKVEVSAPGYIELGAPWSRRALIMTGAAQEPCSVTVAFNKYVHVVLERTGRTGIELSIGMAGETPVEWSGTLTEYDFSSPGRGLCFILAVFRLTGVRVTVTFDISPASGMNLYAGAFLALAQACADYKYIQMHPRKLADMMYDALQACYGVDPGRGYCGALVGGVNMWRWNYPEMSVRPTQLANADLGMNLSLRMLYFVLPGSIYAPQGDIVVGDGLMGTAHRTSYINMLMQVKAIADNLQNGRWDDLNMSLRGYQAASEAIYGDLSATEEAYRQALAGSQGTMVVVQKDNSIMCYSPDPNEITGIRTAWEAIGGQAVLPLQVTFNRMA